MSSRPLLLLALLAGCAPVDASVAPGARLPEDVEDTLDPSDDDGGATSQACRAHVAWVTPEADAEHVALDAPITVGFDAALPDDATWSVVVDGVAGAVALSPDRRVATFRPAAPLDPDHRYEVTARACDDEVRVDFHTLGAPVDPGALVGRTWALHLDELSLVAPSSAGALLTLLGVPDLLAHVRQEADGPHVVVKLAFQPDSRVVPIPCAPELDLGVLELHGNPRFVAAGDALDVTWQGTTLFAEHFSVEGVVADDGERLEALSFRGLIDVRPLEALVGVAGLCDQAAADGQPCEPCSDGAVACLPSLATDGEAVEVPAANFDADVLDLLGFCD